MTNGNQINSLRTSLLFFSMLACLMINPAGSLHAADKKLNISNLKILGLVIGDCTSQEIYSKLGPTTPVKDGVHQLCYVSDRDDTLILFTTESSQCSGFKMMSQKMRFYKWHFCEKSPLVSKHLATQGGIKLGMSKSGLKAILGIPRNESEGILNYVFDWKQKVNTSAMERQSMDAGGIKKKPDPTVKTTIRAEFSETGMILFDVSKISPY